MSIEGITTTQVESTPNFNPTIGAIALGNASNDKKGTKENRGTTPNTQQSTSFEDTLTLSPEAQAQVRELQQRDGEVRAHEQAHVSAGGQYVRGGINYTYTKGPDNKQYATGGSVSLDTSPIQGDPEASAEKARILRSAALAPSNPSAQDQSVAAAASAMESEARVEKQEKQNKEQDEVPSIAENNFAANFANGAEGASVQGTMPQTIVNNSTFTTTQAVAALHTDSATRATQMNSNKMDSALAAYKTQQRSAFIPTDLAPWGTGISLQI